VRLRFGGFVGDRSRGRTVLSSSPRNRCGEGCVGLDARCGDGEALRGRGCLDSLTNSRLLDGLYDSAARESGPRYLSSRSSRLINGGVRGLRSLLFESRYRGAALSRASSSALQWSLIGGVRRDLAM
jgi:hypothetical protein